VSVTVEKDRTPDASEAISEARREAEASCARAPALRDAARMTADDW
jgi:hypothetical protein